MSALRSALLLAALAGACAPTLAPEPRASADYANFLVGRVASRLGDFQAASDRYYLSANARDEDVLGGGVTASLAAGDLARARELAGLEPEVGGPSPYARLVRAAGALTDGRWARARQELDLINGDAAEELTARLMLTWARTGEGRVDTATVELERLAAVRPYGALFAYQQALALDYAGEDAEALAAYAQGADGGLWLAPAVLRHADLLARTGARAEAEAALGAPGVGVDGLAMARAHQRLAQNGRAAEQPLSPAQGAAIGLYGLGAIFLQENDITRALVTLSLALMLDPDLDVARLSFAEGQRELGHLDAARAALAETSASSSYYESARMAAAWLLQQQGRDEEALALALENAAAGEVRPRRALADMYRSLNRYGDAEPLYSELIATDAENWRLYFARGAARERLGRYAEAQADMQRALELEPEQPDVMNYLGYMWIDRGERLQEGLALIQRAVDLRPNSAAIIDSLGWAHYRLGDYEAALEHLERAVELAPADPTLNDHLGDLYWRLDRRTEARFQWRRALALDPDRPGEIAAKLETGLPAVQSAAR